MVGGQEENKERNGNNNEGILRQVLNERKFSICFQYYWFDKKAIRLFKYLVTMKDIAIKDPKANVSEDSDSRPHKKTRLSPTSKSTHGPQPSKYIAKRSRLLKYHFKKVPKTAKHDISSASENLNMTSVIESNTKMIQTEVCSSVKESQQRQMFSYSGDTSSKMIDENSNLVLQRPQFDHLMAQIREHMVSQQQHYVPFASLVNDDRSESNRSKLCVWLFQVCSRFNFRTETCFLAINIIDRTAGLRKLRIDDLPLLGVTALFMAAKYQQIKVPMIEDFVRLLSPNYRISKQSILRLQSTLLILLDFKLSFNSPLIFISDQAEEMKLPTTQIEQAQSLAKQLIIQSSARYWSPSRFASYCIQTVINGNFP